MQYISCVPVESSVDGGVSAVCAMLVMVWYRQHHMEPRGRILYAHICLDFVTSTEGDIILTNGYPTIRVHHYLCHCPMLPGRSKGRCHSGQHAALRLDGETRRDVSWCKMKRRLQDVTGVMDLRGKKTYGSLSPYMTVWCSKRQRNGLR